MFVSFGGLFVFSFSFKVSPMTSFLYVVTIRLLVWCIGMFVSRSASLTLRAWLLQYLIIFHEFLGGA